jgi:hypothetical protein
MTPVNPCARLLVEMRLLAERLGCCPTKNIANRVALSSDLSKE